MSQKENTIIESLLNEEESVSVSLDKPANDGLTSWLISKKDLNLATKFQNILSAKPSPSKPKNSKPIIHPGFRFPKLSPMRPEKMPPASITLKKSSKPESKSLQKSILIEVPYFPISHIQKKSDSDSYIRNQAPIKPRAEQSEGSSLKPKRKFSSIYENSSIFLFSPSNTSIKYKKIKKLTSNSGVFQNYFKPSETVSLLPSNPRSSHLIQAKAKQSALDLNKTSSETGIRHKLSQSEGKSLKKNFILSPIFENLSKYSSMLQNPK